jgi:hypothetical protein
MQISWVHEDLFRYQNLNLVASITKYKTAAFCFTLLGMPASYVYSHRRANRRADQYGQACINHYTHRANWQYPKTR